LVANLSIYFDISKYFKDYLHKFSKNQFYPLFPPILHNPEPCGADGLLRDAHDVVDGLVVHTHFVEDEEEGVENNLLIICKSRAARCNNCL
jgi:hypothetical protein